MAIEANDPKRQAILNAATHMFLQHGFHKVSMDKIAHAAPVSKATLYNHFDSKDTLFAAAVIFDLCKNLLQTLETAEPDTNPIEKNLRTIAEAFVDLIFTEEALALYRLVIAECRDFPELARLIYNGAPTQALNRLQNYLDKLNENPRFSIRNTPYSADAFFSLLKGDLHFRCLLGIAPPPSAEQKRELINAVIAFYLQGISNAPDSI